MQKNHKYSYSSNTKKSPYNKSFRSQKAQHKFQLGLAGENKALSLLQKKGYEILAHNFTSKHGEIDIIAKEGNTIVFVEVKTRSTDYFGHPSTAVDEKKRNNMRKTAHHFLQQNRINSDYRFDMITVLPTKVEHFENITL